MEHDQHTKVLIVDDTSLIRSFLQNLLETYDFTTEIATNGQEAVNKWERKNFDIILMDIEMPVMGGLEATQVIRQREKKEERTYTPIIGVSGAIMTDPEKSCLTAGMDAFLSKPIGIRDAMDVITSFL